MKDLLFKTSFSKIYIIVMIIITLLVVGGYYSYAMFTVSKERNNAISIVTGNLDYTLEVDGVESNILTVSSGETKTFTVTLSNNNNRVARFNFYYVGSLPANVSAGYVIEDGVNTPPTATGVNLAQSGSSGSSNTYIIRVSNSSNSSATITLGVEVGLDYNDLSLPSNGHLFEEAPLEGPVSDIVIENLNENGGTYDDGVDTFITGEEPNNYIWYSGKLWRAVSVNNYAKTTKLVTQWNISTIPYNASGNTAFVGSFMEDWLNDTSVDGFLGNLRDYENFIVTDAKWNATMTTSTSKPAETTMVTDPVGLLNIYEYTMSYSGTTSSNGYLNNGLYWWTLTPYSSSQIRYVNFNGRHSGTSSPANAYGVRPSIYLKSSVRIVDGDGTIDNPYRLNGDNDTNLAGTFLSSRYSGEHITFGNDENNLYRIVSHENGSGTKIVSARPLKENEEYIEIAFDSDDEDAYYSSSNTIGAFLNGDYLTNYIDSSYSSMIEDTTTWYLGTVANGDSYKLAKYTETTGTTITSSTTTAKVGLLRLGELMAGQFDRYAIKGGSSDAGLTKDYWNLTPYSSSSVWHVYNRGDAHYYSLTITYGIRPALNLKSNVVITSGDGTLQNPFTLALS